MMDDAASIRIGLAMAIFRLVKKNVRLSREDRWWREDVASQLVLGPFP